MNLFIGSTPPNGIENVEMTKRIDTQPPLLLAVSRATDNDSIAIDVRSVERSKKKIERDE